jgi:hypoxanthine phosphoribosyltransferase
MITLEGILFEPYIDENTLKTRIQELGKEITSDYIGNTLHIISVLNGAFIFTADLVRNIHSPCNIQFIRLLSYHGTQSSGKITEIIGLNESIRNQHVLIIEDIIDTGLTIEYLYKSILAHEPASLKVASLLSKPEMYRGNIKIDYLGFAIPNRFVVGYGLDLNGFGRNLPAIYQAVK